MIVFWFIIYLIGCRIGYLLVLLDFRKSLHCPLRPMDFQIAMIFALFSWATVLAGIIINFVKGNFTN